MLKSLIRKTSTIVDHALGQAKGAFFAEMDNRAQGGTNMVGLFLGLLIAAIVAVSVFIPVITDAIAENSEAIDGNTETILELLPLFAALILLVALAAPLMRRV